MDLAVLSPKCRSGCDRIGNDKSALHLGSGKTAQPELREFSTSPAVPDPGLPRRTAKATSSDWQVCDPSRPLFFGCCRGDKFKILYHLTDRDPKLVRVNDAGKLFALPQSPGAFAQEIFVLRNEYAAKLGRSLQQEIVIQFCRSVFLRRQDINRPEAQGRRHGSRHMHIHVECEAQRGCLRFLNFRRRSASETWDTSLPDSSNPRRICASSWLWFS